MVILKQAMMRLQGVLISLFKKLIGTADACLNIRHFVEFMIYYRVGALTGIWPFMSTNFHTMKPDEEVNASPSGEGPTSSSVTFYIL